MMDPDKYRLSDAALDNAYEQVYDFYARNRASLTFPRVAILSAQPGAGKSTVYFIIESQFDLDKKPVHVDIDETRPYNGQLKEIFNDDPFATAYYTNADCWLLTKRLLDDSKAARNNVIYETTLRSIGNIEDIIKEFQSDRYKVDLHALAVPSKASILGIHERFERQIASLKLARWTPINFHDEAYAVFPQNVLHLERTAGLELVCVYTRNGTVLYSNNKNPLMLGACEAIEKERARPWTSQEKEKFLSDWKNVEKRVYSRPEGKTKPDWYVKGIEGFVKEAELFCIARAATKTEKPDNEILEAETHHHIFVRDVKTQELICFDKPNSSAPSRPIMGAASSKTKPHP